MEIGVVRNSYESAAGYTHARLFVDEGGFLCWTLEPEDRGLHQDMPLTQILIHPGNTPADTSGCILPGMLQGSIRGQVFDSVKAYRDLMDFYIWPAYQRGEEIWINIY